MYFPFFGNHVGGSAELDAGGSRKGYIVGRGRKPLCGDGYPEYRRTSCFRVFMHRAASPAFIRGDPACKEVEAACTSHILHRGFPHTVISIDPDLYGRHPVFEMQWDRVVPDRIGIGRCHEVCREPSRFIALVAGSMGNSGYIGLACLERVVHVKVKVGSYGYYDIVRFRLRLELLSVIRIFVVHRPIHAGLRFDGEYAYGIACLETAFLAASRFPLPGHGGKCHDPAIRYGFLRPGIFPAAGKGQQQKETADNRCYCSYHYSLFYGGTGRLPRGLVIYLTGTRVMSSSVEVQPSMVTDCPFSPPISASLERMVIE